MSNFRPLAFRRTSMKNIYFRIFLSIIVLIGLSLGPRWGYAIQQKILPSTDSTKRAKNISDTRINKPVDLGINKELKLMFASFGSIANNLFSSGGSSQTNRAMDIPSSMSSNEDDKVLNNVVVYPNPVYISEQLNITYRISKDTNITIKLMDVLGNEIYTFLPAEHVTVGEWTNSFPIPSRLNSGMSYFVQIIAGKDVVVKRISVI
ncbi:MAG: T9SS type A sorting domain-containing protein [Pedobacter sp.]|nr:MAG: T9SS type A sorting domain-containing protein [Pedobacter sp.]